MLRMAIFACALSISPALAQQARPLEIPKGDVGVVQAATLAEQLARYARAAKDPVALIGAARIGRQSGLAVSDYDGWLAEALALAKGDKTLEAMVDDARGAATKGRSASAPPAELVVQAAAVNLHSSRLEPGERVELALVAEEGLTMVAKDASGAVVCRTAAPGVCIFLAASADEHTVEVRNASGAAAPYRLVVRRTPPMKAELKP